jgi:putative toxin-antitoxin system antitoxin component (TIGR02293 family)
MYLLEPNNEMNTLSILAEPMVEYGSSYGSYIQVARKGLTKKNLNQLKKNTELDLDTLSNLLDINPRTIQRRTDDEPFKLNTSEKMIAIAEIYSKGFHVFGNKDKFRKWMITPIKALGGVTPLSLMDTHYGMELVADEIGRIQYGVYS